MGRKLKNQKKSKTKKRKKIVVTAKNLNVLDCTAIAFKREACAVKIAAAMVVTIKKNFPKLEIS